MGKKSFLPNKDKPEGSLKAGGEQVQKAVALPVSDIAVTGCRSMADIVEPAARVMPLIKATVDEKYPWLSRQIDGDNTLKEAPKGLICTASYSIGLKDIADKLSKLINVIEKGIDDYIGGHHENLVSGSSEYLFYEKLQGVIENVSLRSEGNSAPDSDLIVSTCKLFDCQHLRSMRLSRAVNNMLYLLRKEHGEILNKYWWLKDIKIKNRLIINFGRKGTEIVEGSIILRVKDMPSTDGMSPIEIEGAKLKFTQDILVRLRESGAGTSRYNVILFKNESGELDPEEDLPEVIDLTDKELQEHLIRLKKFTIDAALNIAQHIEVSVSDYSMKLYSTLSLIMESSRAGLASSFYISPADVVYNLELSISATEEATLREALFFPPDFNIEDARTDRMSLDEMKSIGLDTLFGYMKAELNSLFHLSVYFVHAEDTKGASDTAIYNISIFLNIFFTRLCNESADEIEFRLGELQELLNEYSKNMDDILGLIKSYNMQVSIESPNFTFAENLKNYVVSFMSTPRSEHEIKLTIDQWLTDCKISFHYIAKDCLDIVTKYDLAEAKEKEIKLMSIAAVSSQAELEKKGKRNKKNRARKKNLRIQKSKMAKSESAERELMSAEEDMQTLVERSYIESAARDAMFLADIESAEVEKELAAKERALEERDLLRAEKEQGLMSVDDIASAAVEKELAAAQAKARKETESMRDADEESKAAGIEYNDRLFKSKNTTPEEGLKVAATIDRKISLLELINLRDPEAHSGIDRRLYNVARMCVDVLAAIFKLEGNVISINIIGSVAKLLALNLISAGGPSDIDFIVETNVDDCELAGVGAKFRRYSKHCVIDGDGMRGGFQHLITKLDTGYGEFKVDVTFYGKDRQLHSPLNVDSHIVITKKESGISFRKVCGDLLSGDNAIPVMPRDIESWFDNFRTPKADYKYYIKMTLKYQVHSRVLSIYDQQYSSLAWACFKYYGSSKVLFSDDSFDSVEILAINSDGEKIILNDAEACVSSVISKDYQRDEMDLFMSGWQQEYYNYAGMFAGGAGADIWYDQCEPAPNERFQPL